MYNVLIVDDEILECEYLLGLIDWDRFEIDNLYTAHSVGQAEALLGRHRADIILCDIEMPQRDGIELLRWVRDADYDCEFIFITCHASFSYAQQALHLNSLDYLLKPVSAGDLTVAMEKALGQIGAKRRNEFGLNREQSREHLVQEALEGTLPADGDVLVERFNKLGVPLRPGERLRPLLFFADWDATDLFLASQYYRRYIAKNMISDVVFDFHSAAVIYGRDEAYFLVLVPETFFRQSGYTLEDRVQILSQKSREHLYINIFVLKGAPCLPSGITGALGELLDWTERNRFAGAHLLELGEAKGEEPPAAIGARQWSPLLLNNEYEKAGESFAAFIHALSQPRYLSADVLTTVFADVMQTVYAVLRERNIPVEQFLSRAEWRELYTTSIKSLGYLRRNVSNLLDRFRQWDSSQELSVSQQIINYVQCNIGTSITREDIARHISLSPEYVSKLFKKETGTALFEYIITTKIDTARDLLAETDMGINRIAAYLGYSNFSHFSKQFREITGLNPNAYRRSVREEQKAL